MKGHSGTRPGRSPEAPRGGRPFPRCAAAGGPRAPGAPRLASGSLLCPQPLLRFPAEARAGGWAAAARARARALGCGSARLARRVLPAPRGGPSRGLGLPSASHRELFVPETLLQTLCKLKLTYQNSHQESITRGEGRAGWKGEVKEHQSLPFSKVLGRIFQ